MKCSDDHWPDTFSEFVKVVAHTAPEDPGRENVCTQIVQQDVSRHCAHSVVALSGRCFFQSMHRPIACDSEEDNPPPPELLPVRVSQGGREPKRKNEPGMARRLSRGDLRGRFISRAPTSSPLTKCQFYIQSTRIRARRAAAKVDRPFPRDSATFTSDSLRGVSRTSSPGGCEPLITRRSARISLGQRGGAVPDAAVLRGRTRRTRTSPTRRSRWISGRRCRTRQGRSERTPRATSGETPPNSSLPSSHPASVVGRCGGALTSLRQHQSSSTCVRYETRRLEASVTF